jgi:hypothetical protein
MLVCVRRMMVVEEEQNNRVWKLHTKVLWWWCLGVQYQAIFYA